uniref:PPOD2 peroxidase short form n=1 Tax=Hydra vulgaris TaxID=6087 RepID=Q2FBK0_HYDVU|nr:PPOD2 peroxidase short form [Hydra vulgaris]AAZ31368.1 PPOD2 peroxidase short form [Hydra vulgaris]
MKFKAKMKLCILFMMVTSLFAKEKRATLVHKVAIKALVNGLFVCAEKAGKQSLRANRAQIGPWETFEISFSDSQTLTLKSFANGKFVCAEKNGQFPLIANRDQAGPWETFTIVPNKEGVALKSHANGKFVTAENAGKSYLIANRDNADIWERFVIIYL